MPAFQARFAAIKQAQQGAAGRASSRKRHDIALPTDALFDVQIKRIHEYKRQLLNILEAVATYADMLDGARPPTACRGSRSSPARRRRPTCAPS